MTTPPLFHRAPTRAEYDAAATALLATLENEICALKALAPGPALALELATIRDRYFAEVRRTAAMINADPDALRRHVRDIALQSLDAAAKAE